MAEYSLDLSKPLPNLTIKHSRGTIDIRVDELYEAQYVGAENGGNLRDRIGKITTYINNKYDLELTEDQAYILVIKAIELVNGLLGN